MECPINQSDVTLPPCKSQQNKMSQKQSLILRYRDGNKLEILTLDENQFSKRGLNVQFTMDFSEIHDLSAFTCAINDYTHNFDFHLLTL